ncbi:MAG: ATP-binding protein [Syntrophales bacterium]
MTIRTKLAINVITLVCSFLVVMLIYIVVTDRMDESARKGMIANRIVIGVSDMNTITYDYVMNPSERARQQWERKYASLGELVATEIFTKEETRAILHRIRGNLGEAHQFFEKILENNQKKERTTAAAQAVLDENNERNVAQLMARSQLMISDAYSLTRVSYEEIDSLQTWSYGLIMIAIFIAMMIAGTISYVLSWNISASLRTLKQGTEIIARGDLAYRLPIRGKDEIAVLSRAFNEMTERLSTSYASLAAEIREREKAQEALHAANLYTRSLIEVSLDPLITISADGKIMDVNQAMELAAGLPREKLIGSDFSGYFTDPPRAREGYEKVFSRGFVRDYPLAIRHASGQITEVLYNAAVFKNEAGEVQGVFAAARDITELRAAQKALQRSHDELEHRVEERTAELQERTRQLETSNRELEGFSYSVSHDLRAPLRAIDGFSARLMRDSREKLDGDGVRKLAAIGRNARKMGQLIDDLLSFSRLSRKAMNVMQFSMEIMANDVWRELRDLNPDRELDFRTAPMVPAFGDPSLIRQVLVNLLSNALKFTRERRPAVIEMGSCTEGGDVVYYVKDNGVGFDMRYYDKLFGVFERLHHEEDYEGTGVGLAIVQRVIDRHGGRIWAESTLNEGATFYFTLSGKETSIA